MKSLARLIIFVLAVTSLGVLHAANPHDELKQLTAQLQSNPSDTALREKIIKLARSLQPAPAIPESANRAFVKGAVFLKDAKNQAGYELAVNAYREALVIAPWWGNAYYNLAVAQESSGKPEEAIASLKLYLLTQPSGKDAREAQNRIYAIEAKQELAAKGSLDAGRARQESASAMSGLWALGWTGGIDRLPTGNPKWTWKSESTGNGLLRIRLVRALNYYEGRGEVEMPLYEQIESHWEFLLSVDGNKVGGNLSAGVYPGWRCPPWQAEVSGEVKNDGRVLVLSFTDQYKPTHNGACERNYTPAQRYYYRQN